MIYGLKKEQCTYYNHKTSFTSLNNLLVSPILIAFLEKAFFQRRTWQVLHLLGRLKIFVVIERRGGQALRARDHGLVTAC